MTAGVRPQRLVVVVGTGTEVGKTWVSARLAERWRAGGRTVAARKPAQSFEPADAGAGVTDAHLLAAATGADPDQVCPAHRWYPTPMAPPMAAAVLGRPPIALDDLVDELVWPADTDRGLVETAGGARSPLADDGDAVALVGRLAPDAVVVVADAGLGTINAVRLTADAVASAGVVPGRLVVHLNRFDGADDLHHRNAGWLAQRDGWALTTTVRDLADVLDGD